MIFMYPAIFIDRDGVIIENRADYVRSWSDVVLFPQAISALARINTSPYKIVMVTNQSGIGRGFFTLETARQINQRLVKLIEKAGGRIDGVFMCPHQPEDHCDCRKPKPGLLLQARSELDLDLSRSLLIGDALSDIKAGRAAGIPDNVLVLTGRGREQAQLPDAQNMQPFSVYNNLQEALSALL
jgi:D-glycero-D-manno-heptose 1,7-bisphosphate phosphatase